MGRVINGVSKGSKGRVVSARVSKGRVVSIRVSTRARSAKVGRSVQGSV